MKNCLFCDKEVAFAEVIRYNRTGLLGVVCDTCKANVFEYPSTLWTLVGTYADGVTITTNNQGQRP